MKIVLCTNTSWNIFNFRLNLARALKEAGYEVILVAPYDKYSETLKEEFEYYDIYMNNKGTNPKEDIKTLLEFYKLYKEIQPDVVLNYTIKPNIYGNIVCKWLKIKTINNISGLGTVFITKNLVTKIVKFLYKYALASSSKIFFQNKDDRDLFIDHKLVHGDKCEILPGSGIDTNEFSPITYVKENEQFVFLLIARMLWDKGVGEYVDAAKIVKERFPNVEFQLLGSLDAVNNSAISKKQMSTWSDEGYINYLGTTDKVKEFIAKADCVVLPSYREGTPRTLLESASMAKPLIATNVPGCKDVVDDGINGYLCEVKNSEDLARKMEMLLQLSDEEKIKMGKLGREKIKATYDETFVINSYKSAINMIK